ncbi:serine protease [Nostoc sp. FACHB-110]|uniref:S1 family peptidase n=1 Tax=Nostoc sp. FACHB-110 TaxID=2692834 RepID=UPI001686E3A3|nr:serine protease [Nostoc sp. FACHB-110]MBD2441054.1 trypsin-like peptidase domain-containing protein [Nostoc sp. FACHB-110]
MKFHRLILVVCFSSISLALSASVPVVSVSAPSYSAKSITVKVLSQDFLGSGILLRQHRAVYTVLTNAHVIQAGDPPYRVQTPDGKIYTANLPQRLSFGKNDLAVLQFQSADSMYAVASFGSSPTVGDDVFTAGFPAAEDAGKKQRFAFTSGKVALVLGKPLEGGYQLGFTNSIKNGMSGGPLLNSQGQVIGINGMQAYPLWDAPSVFVDGSKADERLHQRIIRLSWAVPISKVIQKMPNAGNTKVETVFNQTD